MQSSFSIEPNQLLKSSGKSFSKFAISIAICPVEVLNRGTSSA